MFPNGVGSESWHANNVAEVFYNNFNFEVFPFQKKGVAHGVDVVNNYAANWFISNYIHGPLPRPLLDGEKVANQSFTYGIWISSTDNDYDRYIDAFGTIVVSASTMEQQHQSVHQLPATTASL